MNIKSKFIEAYYKKPTIADNLLAIYGLPYSIVCLAMAITHKATVEHIMSILMLYVIMGMMSHTFVENSLLKKESTTIDYVLAIMMSLFCTIGAIALIWGANGI